MVMHRGRARFIWWGAWGPGHLGSLSGRLSKSLKIKNARHTHITNEKKYEVLVGGPLLVGGLEPGHPPP